MYTTQNTKISDDNIFFNQEYIPKLSKGIAATCETDITLDQCSKALGELANDKSPGSDGFNAEFFKYFWPDISDLVLDSFNFAFKRENSLLGREGVSSHLLIKRIKTLGFSKIGDPSLCSIRTTKY